MDTTAPSAPPAPATPTLSSTAALPPPFPGSSGSSLKPIGAGLVLVAFAVAALVTARRRKRAPRLVEILESSSLGPKRSLVVARMGDELLLLGSSEGGITLLSTRPAPATPAALPAAAAAEPTRFELILGESVDDLELRRKLAAGAAGSVR
jgi:flagellar protein FliO/FliZ